MLFEVREDLNHLHFWVTGRDTWLPGHMLEREALRAPHHLGLEASIQYEGGTTLPTLSPHHYMERERARDYS